MYESEIFLLSASDKSKYAIEKSMPLTGYAGFESITNFVAHTNENFFHSASLFPRNQEEPKC